jgi:hypothetical protein
MSEKNKLKNILVIPCLLSAACFVQADEKGDDDKSFAYSFVAIGVENIHYEESVSQIPVTTDVTVTNPVLTTGGLYTFNDEWDFTIIAMSTMSSNISTEDWRVNGGSVGNAFKDEFNLSSNHLQSNDFTFTTARTNVSLHYKLTPKWRWVLDGEFSYKTFKRSNFDAFSEDFIISNVVEESVSDLSLSTGIGYESGSVENNEPQLSFKMTAGLPVWNETTNTEYQGVVFKNQRGYDFELNASYYYPLYQGLSMGVFVNYHLSERDGMSVENDSFSLELPKNTLQATRAGVGFKWNFE